MEVIINDLKITISNTNIHLHDSFKIKTKEEKLFILHEIINVFPKILEYRTIKSMLREWRAHNILYKLHILRESTKHTDIEFKQNFIFKIGYFLISLLPIE